MVIIGNIYYDYDYMMQICYNEIVNMYLAESNM